MATFSQVCFYFDLVILFLLLPHSAAVSIATAPGFGVRRFNMLEQKVGNYVPILKDVLRDLSLHPTQVTRPPAPHGPAVTSTDMKNDIDAKPQHELLLSCGNDKTARITNISSCTEVASAPTRGAYFEIFSLIYHHQNWEFWITRVKIK